MAKKEKGIKEFIDDVISKKDNPEELISKKFIGDSLGIISFIFGLLSVVFFFTSIIALIAGAVGLVVAIMQMRRAKSKWATWGAILSAIGIILSIAATIIIISLLDESAGFISGIFRGINIREFANLPQNSTDIVGIIIRSIISG